jgi:hypothetical protein
MKILKQILIFIIIFLLYTHTLGFFYDYGFKFLKPVFFIILSIFMITFLLLLSKKPFAPFKLNIYKWILFYISIIYTYIIFFHSYLEVGELFKILVNPMILLFFITALIYMDDENLSVTKKAILLAVLLSVFNNFFEFFNPSLYYIDTREYSIGRSQGFFQGPNESATAIVIGLLITYNIVYERLKILFLLITFIGVALTFSRSGILCWFVAISLLSYCNIISRKVLFMLMTILSIILFITIPILIEFISSTSSNAEYILSRISFFADSQYSGETYQTSERAVLINEALKLFNNNPLVGSGLGATRYWEYVKNTGAHNTIIDLMAQFGVLGMIIYFSLLFTIAWKATGEYKRLAIVYISVIFVDGIFTHNQLLNYPYIISFAFMANMSYLSSKQSKRRLKL